ncbi:MAG: M15 family metallopeptidase [Balneolaceae bacterium]
MSNILLAKKYSLIIIFIAISISVKAQSIFPFVEINKVSESIIKEIRYATKYNFVGEKIDGYTEPKCYLTSSAAEALSRVQAKLANKSMALKIFDCYRPQRAVNNFVSWAKSVETNATKDIYFPRVPSDELFEKGYIAERSGHSRGSTVDLTIVKLPYEPPVNYIYNCLEPEGYIYRGSELNMGTAYDCFDEKSNTHNQELEKEIIENRMMLLKIMEEEGFANYSKEWWHFTFKPETYPDTYFDLPIE